jgi:hypothetical protein
MPVWAPLRHFKVPEKDIISTDSKFNPDLCSLDQLIGHATVANALTKYTEQDLSLALWYSSASDSSIGGTSHGSSKVRSHQWPAEHIRLYNTNATSTDKILSSGACGNTPRQSINSYR